MRIKLFLLVLAIIALCAGCYNRASTTSHTEKRATERHETATEREISYESKAATELYTLTSEYDSLLIEKDTAGGVKLRIYGGKQASTLNVSKNEEAGYAKEKEMELTITDTSDIAKNEDTQTAINASTPAQIKQKANTWMWVAITLILLVIVIIVAKKATS
jgi:hypothetical protein